VSASGLREEIPQQYFPPGDNVHLFHARMGKFSDLLLEGKNATVSAVPDVIQL
jgi:hypothetical protein